MGRVSTRRLSAKPRKGAKHSKNACRNLCSGESRPGVSVTKKGKTQLRRLNRESVAEGGDVTSRGFAAGTLSRRERRLIVRPTRSPPSRVPVRTGKP
jgi:hypothetical protein